jgi:hypothetical protein
VSRYEEIPTFQGLTSSLSSGCCWWLGRTKPDDHHLVITLKMGTGLVPGKSENFHILMQLSARENFGEQKD